jgi:sugar phosphate isomerase/epimerase
MKATPAISASMYAPPEMDDFLAMVDRLGVKAVEVPTQTACDLGVDRMRQASRGGGLKIILATTLTLAEGAVANGIGAVQRALAFAHDVDADVINLYCAAAGGAAGREARDAFCLIMEQVLPQANVTLALENELNPESGVFALFESWKWVSERLPEPFGLTLDLGNFFASGSEVAPEDVKSLLSRIRHLHLKDVIPLTEELDRKHPNWSRWRGAGGWFLGVPPGQGIVDYPRFLEAFADYSGYYTLEPFRDEKPLQEGLQFVRRHGFPEDHS